MKHQRSFVFLNNKGITLIEVLISVMISGIAVVIFAGSVSLGMGGFNQQQNFLLMDDLTSHVAQLMDDNELCSANFKGQKIPPSPPTPYPLLLVESVGLKAWAANGELSIEPTVHKGLKYQEKISVDDFKFKLLNRTSQDKYIGQLELTYSYKDKVFHRNVSLMVTSKEGLVESCGRFLPRNVAKKNRGGWSNTCEDWAEQGWQSRDHCMQDGRWHLVMMTTPTGVTSQGSKADVLKYLRMGADLRLKLPQGFLGFTGGYEECRAVEILNGEWVCYVVARTGVPEYKTGSVPGSVSYFSQNSTLSIRDPHIVMSVPLGWYVRF